MRNYGNIALTAILALTIFPAQAAPFKLGANFPTLIDGLHAEKALVTTAEQGVKKAKSKAAAQNKKPAANDTQTAEAKTKPDAQADEQALKQAPPVPGNTLEVLESAGQFKTFTKLLRASGFTAMMQGQGSYTIFAPNDKAFARLSASQLNNLQRPENRQQLAQILSHHIIGGERLSRQALADLKKPLTTMAGQTLSVRSANGKTVIDASNLIEKPIASSNGTVHVIDLMLVPMPMVATTPPQTSIQTEQAATGADTATKQPDAMTQQAHAAASTGKAATPIEPTKETGN